MWVHSEIYLRKGGAFSTQLFLPCFSILFFILWFRVKEKQRKKQRYGNMNNSFRGEKELQNQKQIVESEAMNIRNITFFFIRMSNLNILRISASNVLKTLLGVHLILSICGNQAEAKIRFIDLQPLRWPARKQKEI